MYYFYLLSITKSIFNGDDDVVSKKYLSSNKLPLVNVLY